MKLYRLFIWIVVFFSALCILAENLQASSNRTTFIDRGGNGSKEDTFSFAVIGDSQPRGTFGQPSVLKKIIDEVNDTDIAFVIHLGDRIQGSKDAEIVKKQYEEFFAVIAGLKIKIYYVAGNHDIKKMKTNEQIYNQLFGQPYYSFSYKNSFFIVLDTEVVGQEASIEGNQMQWLKNELEKSRKYSNVFVFMHRPLFSVLFPKKNHLHFISQKHRDNLVAIFRQYGVTTVFAGHEHLYHSGQWDGLHQIISGGAGAPFHFYPSGNFYHYIKVTVDKRQITIKAIPVGENH